MRLILFFHIVRSLELPNVITVSMVLDPFLNAFNNLQAEIDGKVNCSFRFQTSAFVLTVVAVLKRGELCNSGFQVRIDPVRESKLRECISLWQGRLPKKAIRAWRRQ
jgi:hypothetical protein